MRAFIYILSAGAALLLGCRPESAQPSPPLSFYVVHEQQMDGGRFINTPEFPNLGYIAATPDLEITTLKAVVPEESLPDIMVDKDGKETVMPPSPPSLAITMQPEDASRFAKITEKAMGQRVLLMLGDVPLMAPRVMSPVHTESLSIRLPADSNHKKIENDLKNLVR